MDGNKTKDDTNNQAEPVSTEPTAAAAEPVAVVPSDITPASPAAVESEPVPAIETDTSTLQVAGEAASKSPLKLYAAVAVGIVILGLGLVFMLEREGRLETGLFSFMTERAERGPVASVNGVSISRADFNSMLDQVKQEAVQQGMDANDPMMVAQLEPEAVNRLVNAELLKQAAEAAGITATDEQIEASFEEISLQIGGPEALMARMADLGFTEERLRSDIENQIVIQAYLDSTLNLSEIEVSADAIKAFYEEAAAQQEVPPLAEVSEEIYEILRREQENLLVTELINRLKTEAEVEVLI